ncbi:hypothetical protein Ancab_036492 [Ancistrocladus abbreviatus]
MMMMSNGANFECCMCGDYGISYELFRCKVCQFRSQHSYCSNLYPKAESYRVCNWCLIEEADKASNASNNSSSPYKSGTGGKEDPQHHGKHKKKSNGDHHGGVPVKGGQIKKQRSPEGSPKAAAGRRWMDAGNSNNGSGAVAERVIRRTKPEKMTNSNATNVTKHVFRNKVRRYKLLEEVSS